MRNRRIAGHSIVALTAGLLLVAGLGAPSAAYQRPGRSELVSLNSQGGQLERPLGRSWKTGSSDVPSEVSISGSGRYVAFATDAANLVEGDRNGVADVFVYDRQKDRVELVSHASDGETAVSAGIVVPLLRGSLNPSISRSGRYVVFASDAINLVSNDTNLKVDIFLHDRKNGSTTRISVGPNGQEADGDSKQPYISANGRYVSFNSSATNLADADDLIPPVVPLLPGSDEVESKSRAYVRDLARETNLLVSIGPEGEDLESHCVTPPTPDGRFIAFSAEVHPFNRLPPTTRPLFRDLKKKKSIFIGPSPEDEPAGNYQANVCSQDLTPNGRYVTLSDGGGKTDYVPSDSEGVTTFIWDRNTERVEALSVYSYGGKPYGGNGGGGRMSADGRFVLVGGNAPLASPEGQPDKPGALLDPQRPTGEHDSDWFVFDRQTGAHDRITVPITGKADLADHDDRLAWGSDITRDGRYVAFSSCAEDLVRGDSNEECDVFARDRGLPVRAGGFGGSPGSPEPPPDDEICIAPDVCIPPGAVVSSSDATNDLHEVLTEQGANLYGASLAYRPQYEDLFAAIELEHMPQVLPGFSPIFYALRFEAKGKSYEVRATASLGGTFGLFDCTDSLTCTKVADLRGGYGTTGMRVVVSLPLDEIGLKAGGKLKKVEAFSGLGSYLTGATKVLDTVRLK